MAILKLSKTILILLIIIISVTYTCNTLYGEQDKFESKQNSEIEYCKKNIFIAQSDYKISLYEYNIKEINGLKVNIIRKGKVIKTFSKIDKNEKNISFSYERIMKSDTIEVKLKKDIYYIHGFENDYWLESKPNGCYLSKYKINKIDISGILEDRIVLKKKYLN